MLKKNLIANFANQLLGVGFPVITQIYIIRHLDLVDIGFWNILLAGQSIVVLCVSFVGLYAIKEISSTNDIEIHSKLITNFLSISYILIVIPLSASLLYFLHSYQDNWHIILICFLPLLTSPLAAEYYFQATLKNDLVFYRRLASRTLFMVLLFSLVKEPSDFVVYAYIVSLTLVFEHAINFFFIRRLFSLESLSLNEIIKNFRASIGYLPFRLTYNTLPQISILIGARFIHAETLAVYSILLKLVNLATTFVSSTVMVIFPYRLNRKHAQPENVPTRDDYLFYFILTGIVAAGVVAGLVISKELIFFLFLSNQTGQLGGFSILAMYALVHSLYNYVVFNHFFEHNRVRKVVVANICMILIFVAMIYSVSYFNMNVPIPLIFILAAIFPAATLLVVSFRERRIKKMGVD